jgi:membrane dipeptidase
MRRGATDEQVRKLVGENILRVWQQNEIIAAHIQNQKDGKPVESIWEGRAKPTWDGDLPTLKGYQGGVV